MSTTDTTILNSLQAARTPRAKKVPAPIAKRSDKLKQLMKEYKPLVKEYLKVNPECKIKMEGCTIKATQVHHVRGRGANLLNQDDWLPSCTHCNVIEIERDTKKAFELGVKKSRLTKS